MSKREQNLSEAYGINHREKVGEGEEHYLGEVRDVHGLGLLKSEERLCT